MGAFPNPSIFGRVAAATAGLLRLGPWGVFLVVVLTACNDGIEKQSLRTASDARLENPSLTTATVEDGKIKLAGSGMDLVEKVTLRDEHGNETEMVLLEQQDDTITLVATEATKLISGAVYSMFVSTAHAQELVPIQIVVEGGSSETILDGAVTTEKLAPASITLDKLANMGAQHGYVLKWDADLGRWFPSPDAGANIDGVGTVTSIQMGAGLVGGEITDSGTIAVDVGTGAGQIPQINDDGNLSIPGMFQVLSQGGFGLLNAEAGSDFRVINDGFFRIVDGKSDTDRFSISPDGQIFVRGDLLVNGSSLSVGGVQVCLADGSNCPAIGGGGGGGSYVAGTGIVIENSAGSSTIRVDSNLVPLLVSGKIPTSLLPSLDAASIGSGVLNKARLPVSSGSTDGILNAADFVRFNAKEDALPSGGTASHFLRGDKVWVVLNTSAVAEGTNLYFTNARARAAAIENTIVSGVTDRGPSQNAVFGALAAKQQLLDATTDITTGDVTVADNQSLKLSEASINGTEGISLRAPSTLGADITLVLPNSDGAVGEVLTTDGAGVLSWQAMAPGGAAGGDLSGTFPNPTISGLAATKIGGGTVDNTEFGYLNGVTSAIQTQLNSKQVAIDGSVDVTARSVTLDNEGAVQFREATGNGTEFIGLKAPAAVGTSTTFTLPDQDGSAGDILVTDGSGILSWTGAGPAPGPAGGDLTGAYPNPTIANDAVDSAAIAAGTIVDSDVNASAGIAATKIGNGNVDNTELSYVNGVTSAIQTQLDGKQATITGTTDLSTGDITITDQQGLLLSEASGSGTDTIRIQAPSAVTGNVVLTLPDGDGNAGQVLQTDGAGVLTWTDQSTGGAAGGDLTGTYPNPTIAANAVGSAEVAVDSLTAADLAADSVGASEIATGAVGTDEVAADSLTAADLAADSVEASEIAAGAVGTSEVAADSLTAADLAADSVGASEIATGAVGTDEVAADSLTAADLAADSVEASEIATGAVGTSEIAAGAIVDSDVNASAGIAATKIGTGAVDNTELSYVDGVTSAIQTQLDGKQATITATTDLSMGDVTLTDQQGLILAEDNANGSHTIRVQAPASVTANTTLTLPDGDGTSGQVLQTDGTGVLSWVTNAPNGPAGGDLSGTFPNPTIGNDAVDSAAIAAGAIVDSDVNASAGIAATKIGTGAVDNTELSYVDGVTSAIQTQLDGKQATITATTDLSMGDVTLTDQQGLLLAEDSANGTHTIRVQAPASVTANTTLTLPDGDGTSGQVLQTDGAGVLTWANQSAAGAAGGDLTGTYPNPTIGNDAVDSAAIAAGAIVDSDVNASAGIAATKIGTGAVDNTELSYVDGVTSAIQTQLDGKQATITATTDLSMGDVTLTDQQGLLLAEDSANGTHTIRVQAPASVTANTTLTLPDGDGNSGQVLQTDGAGVLTWVDQSAAGAAGGDLTGTYPNPTIAGNAVGSAEVANNSLTASDLAPDSVDSSEIAANAVGTSEVSDNSLTADDLAAGSVGTSEVANNSLTASDLAPDSVDSSEIATDAVGNDELDTSQNYVFSGTLKGTNGIFAEDQTSFNMRELDANGNQQVSLRAPASIASNYTLTFPDSAPSADHLLLSDGSGNLTFNKIQTVNIAADAVTSAKIASQTIASGNIAADAITTAKIADNAVTTGKLDANAITSGKIASSAVTSGKIASDAVTSGKIASDAVTSGKIAANTITADDIAAGAVGASELANSESFTMSGLTVDNTATDGMLYVRGTTSTARGALRLRNTSANDIGIGFQTNGSNTRFQIFAKHASNQLVIEDGAGDNILTIEDNNRVGINNTNPSEALEVGGDARKSSGGSSWQTTSDRRLKQDIEGFDRGLDEVLQMRPVSFRYKDIAERGLSSEKIQYGYVAQEIQELVPEAVAEGDDGFLSLHFDPIHITVVNAVQELKSLVDEMIDGLKSQIAELFGITDQLREENRQLQEKVDSQQQQIEQLKSAICDLNADAAVCRKP